MRHLAIVLPFAALAACTPLSTEPCTSTDVAIGPDEATDIGLTAAELLERTAGEWDAPIYWDDGEEGRVAFAVTPLADVVLQEREHAEGAVTVTGKDGRELTVCSDRLYLPARFDLVAADGSLDEHHDIEIVVEASGGAFDAEEPIVTTVRVEASELGGTWLPEPDETVEFVPDEVHVEFELSFSDPSHGVHGELHAVFELLDPDGGVVESEVLYPAAFGTPG